VRRRRGNRIRLNPIRRSRLPIRNPSTLRVRHSLRAIRTRARLRRTKFSSQVFKSGFLRASRVQGAAPVLFCARTAPTHGATGPRTSSRRRQAADVRRRTSSRAEGLMWCSRIDRRLCVIRFQGGDLEQKHPLQLMQGAVVRTDVRAQFHAAKRVAEDTSQLLVFGHDKPYDASGSPTGCLVQGCFRVRRPITKVLVTRPMRGATRAPTAREGATPAAFTLEFRERPGRMIQGCPPLRSARDLKHKHG
jgi:hypothetical protein